MSPHASSRQMPLSSGLNVIALVSGGKDSLFSVLHCQANGHRVVALANLHPQPAAPSSCASELVGPARTTDTDEEDLNSFMYQTVGHQVIPLYADATGIPLYRRAIVGAAVQSSKDYGYCAQAAAAAAGARSDANAAPAPPAGAGQAGMDETESMVPLLRTIMAAHPEANAVTAGAILSTYQRTRVESVATRLGLIPLAYLWNFPVLPAWADDEAGAGAVPAPLGAADPLADAQLLRDMAAVGLDARIIKVATGGLDDSFLWTNLATAAGMARVARGMRRFATGELGAVLGEGGEFETLVVDGPPGLFRKRIVVEETDRHVVREGGDNSWLRIGKARLEEKSDGAESAEHTHPRRPALLDTRFQSVLEGLEGSDITLAEEAASQDPDLESMAATRIMHWSIAADIGPHTSIEQETRSLVNNIRTQLQKSSLNPEAIISTTILLRNMADFSKINTIYGSLFPFPNPPSRVTVSVGDQLPQDCNVFIYLSILPSLAPRQRQGLHVQSRSYWAPANIGPYSQAISVPIDVLAAPDAAVFRPEIVTIAGQIPLVPASMEFPAGADTLALDAILSLQHLWRIGADRGVQWWSSAAAFFPRAQNTETMARNARRAGKAWEAAHCWSDATDDDSDDENGPDLWDRRYNSAYKSYSTDAGTMRPSLPDWTVLSGANKPVPPFFAAEVAELPRSASIEWQAHAGFAHLGASSVVPARYTTPGAETWSVAVSSAAGTTVVYQAWFLSYAHAVQLLSPAQEEHDHNATTARAGLASLGFIQDILRSHGPPSFATPVVQYVDSSLFAMPALAPEGSGIPAVPCYSLWDGRGERLGVVVIGSGARRADVEADM